MRLIDEDALKAKLTDYKTIIEHANADISTMTVAAKILSEAPTVDAVPVVRCRECKWKCDCAHEDGEWFCADGEK